MSLSKTKPKTDDLVHWIFDYFATDQNQQAPTLKNEDANNLKLVCWPFCEPYFAPTQPVFLFDGWTKDFLSRTRRIQVRDGILPLLWFFQETSPKDFPNTLVIHEDLAWLVPPKWLNQTMLYRIQSTKPLEPQDAKGLVIGGLMSPPFVDRVELEEQLDDLITCIGADRIRKLPIQVYFPYRNPYLFRCHWDEDLFLTVPLLMARKLGLEIKPINIPQLEGLRTLEGHYYHELNKGWIVKDSHLQHTVLGKGASLIPEAAKRKKIAAIETIPLSRHHELVVLKNNYPKSAAEQNQQYRNTLAREYVNIAEFIYTKRRFGPIWPQWFDALGKAADKNRNSIFGAISE